MSPLHRFGADVWKLAMRSALSPADSTARSGAIFKSTLFEKKFSTSIATEALASRRVDLAHASKAKQSRP